MADKLIDILDLSNVENILMKEPYSFKLEPEIIPALKSIAESENRSLNNLVETALRDFIQSRGGGVKKGILNKLDKTKKAKN